MRANTGTFDAAHSFHVQADFHDSVGSHITLCTDHIGKAELLRFLESPWLAICLSWQSAPFLENFVGV